MDFELDGKQLVFEEPALRAVVREAMDKHMGARALRSIMEDAMLDIMFELPSRKDVYQCTITKDVISKKKPPKYTLHKEEKRRARA